MTTSTAPLKAKEVINTLLDAYEKLTKELGSPNHKVFDGMRKVSRVFAQSPNRETIIELIALMMQPANEAAYYRTVVDPLHKGKQNIQVNIKTGMGMPVDPEMQLEIFAFLDSPEFRAKDFSKAFAKALNERMKKYKS